ncbi:MAG TPA: energy transducer TonB [Thiobacillus sp.]
MHTITPESGLAHPRLSEGVLGAVILAHLVIVVLAGALPYTRSVPPPAAPTPLFVQLIEPDMRPARQVAPHTETRPPPQPAVPTPSLPVLVAPPAPTPARVEAVKPEPVVHKTEPVRQEPTRAELPAPITAPTPIPVQAATPTDMAKPVPPPPLAVTQPRFNADYLDNPKPPYPSASRRMGEEGEVRLRVQVDPAGNTQQIEIYRSSGFPRLDQAALDTVKQWRFIPARQGEQPITAWVIVPIQFSLRS